MPDLGKERVLAERMRRQRLAKPLAASEDYVALFRQLQPVSPVMSGQGHRHDPPGKHTANLLWGIWEDGIE